MQHQTHWHGSGEIERSINLCRAASEDHGAQHQAHVDMHGEVHSARNQIHVDTQVRIIERSYA